MSDRFNPGLSLNLLASELACLTEAIPVGGAAS